MTQPTPQTLNSNDVQPGMTPEQTPPKPPPPSNLGDAEAELARIRSAKQVAYQEYRDYLDRNPEIKVNETDQQAYRQAEGTISFNDPSGPSTGTKLVFDLDATNRVRPYLSLVEREKELAAAIKNKQFGTEDAGMSYVESEKLKQDEAKREFTDAVTRIKALYDFQDQEGEWMQENAESNAQRITDINAGKADRGSSIIRPTYMAPETRYSDVIEPSIPSKVPPYYSMSEAVGLEGQEGLGGGISGYAKGTGFATLPSSMGNQQAGFKSPGNIDPEIAWMIGMPDVPNIYDSKLVPPLPPTDPSMIKRQPAAPPQPAANPGFARLP